MLVLMLVAVNELRSTDNAAQDASNVIVATSRAGGSMQELERQLRGYLAQPTPNGAEMVSKQVGVMRRQLNVLNDSLGDANDDQAVEAEIRAEAHSARQFIDESVVPKLTGPTPQVSARQLFLLENQAEGIDIKLNRLVEQQRASLLPRRERTGRLAHLAEVVGIAGIVAMLVIVAGCLYYMRRSVLAPLRRVAAAARALAAGDLHARVGHAHGGSGEVAELARTFDGMAASLQESRDALERQNAELESRGAELVDAVRSAREGASVLRAVLDATPDAIALLDRDGESIVDNPPMRTVRDAFGPLATAVDQDGTLVPLDVGPEPEETRDEITLMGTRRSFARYAAPVRDSHGRLVGRLLVLREVTREREADRVKEEFFALVSHELRTPLTAILGYVELVLGEHAPNSEVELERHRYLQIVERNSQRLLRLVGDLLFAAQVESGSLLLEPGIVDLAEITRDAVEAARPRAEDAGILLNAKIEPFGPCVGDRDRLAQVLDNLISNALKFTPADGSVEVRLLATGDVAVLEVADTGVGVPSEEQERLFDRFFRASNATKRAVPGVGLGLMIVRAIVVAHGGSIGISSAVGEGTTFTVQLPITQAGGRPSAPAVEQVAYSDDSERTPGAPAPQR
ncbi:MAG TPA: ATP-binding protein [Conexibacter sp.]